MLRRSLMAGYVCMQALAAGAANYHTLDSIFISHRSNFSVSWDSQIPLFSSLSIPVHVPEKKIKIFLAHWALGSLHQEHLGLGRRRCRSSLQDWWLPARLRRRSAAQSPPFQILTGAHAPLTPQRPLGQPSSALPFSPDEVGQPLQSLHLPR